MVEPSFLNVLRQIYARLSDSDVDWLVTASFGLALQGLPIETHDIDLQTTQAGAYEIERRFAEFVTKPVTFSESEYIRSHFGALTIDGIQVEIMGDFQIRLADGTWEEPIDLQTIKRFIEVDGMRIPIPSLESENEAYAKLGRWERVAILRQWLQKEGDAAKSR